MYINLQLFLFLMIKSSNCIVLSIVLYMYTVSIILLINFIVLLIDSSNFQSLIDNLDNLNNNEIQKLVDILLDKQKTADQWKTVSFFVMKILFGL